MEKKKIKKIYFLPNVITAFGLSCGLFVIFKMNMTDKGEVTEQLLITVSALLLLAAFADLLDGAIARVMNAVSTFGSTFDVLADAISFGVAPSIIILKSLAIAPGTKFSFIIMSSAILYSLCGVLRLVRFNISSMAEKDDLELALANKKNFTGLPIPGGAACAISMNLFLFSQDVNAIVSISDLVRTSILAFTLVLLGYLMISRWKFPSFKSLEIRVASFKKVFLTVISAVFIFFGILHAFPIVFFILSWGYVILALILSIIRLIAGRKSKTLEDYEPELDDLDEIE